MKTSEHGFIFYVFGRAVPSKEWYISPKRVSRLYRVHSGVARVKNSNGEFQKLSIGHDYFFPEKLDFSVYQDEHNRLDHTYVDFIMPYTVAVDDVLDLTEVNNSVTASILNSIFTFCEEKTVNAASKNDIDILDGLFSSLFASLGLTRANENDISKALRYIHNNSKDYISVSNLADLLHKNINVFIRQFKSVVGITPHQYIIEYRLTKAYYLIENGSSVSEAAYDSGYSSVAAFSKAFKIFFGYSPSGIKSRKEG